ncbi:sporulation protein Cse60 [Limosilactobacillus mucosae]
MIKTKIFMQGFGKPCIDEQINKWIAKHPDYIIVDIKLQSSVVDDIDQYWVCRDALVIYQEYEK